MCAAKPPELSPRSSMTPQANGTVLLRHRVAAEDDFERAAQDVFALVQAAQRRHPGNSRRLEITIDGHTGERGGFDADFFEFQQEFMLGAMGRFFTWIEMPLTGELTNSSPQENDVGDALRVNDQDTEEGRG